MLGCAAGNFEREVRVYAVDFRSYADSGFLFTPDRYEGDYDSVGMLAVQVLPRSIEPQRGEDGGFGEREVENIYADAVLRDLYKSAIDLSSGCRHQS